MSTTILAVAYAALLATTAPLAQGPGTFDKKTVYTFSGPVELPGVALKPGQYIFRLADPDTTRKILQVVSADGKQVYGNFFWIPLDRPEAKSEPEVRLIEAPAGAPPAIRAVWYPGERTGWELIYPRQQALRIARNAANPVLTTKADSAKVDETPDDLTRVSSSGQDVSLDAKQDAPPAPVATAGRAETDPAVAAPARPAAKSQSPADAPAPGAVVAQNEPRTTQPPRDPAPDRDPAPEADRERLPQTASPQMLIGIVSLCLLGAAGALRMWRTARAHSTRSE
jgi:hypothetical protein